MILNDTFGDLFCETWKSLSWFSLLSNPSMGSTLIQAFQGKQSDLVALHRGNWCLDGHLFVMKQGLHPKNARMHGCIKQPTKNVDGYRGSLVFCCKGAFWMAKNSLHIFLPIWFSRHFWVPRTLQNLLNQPTSAGFNVARSLSSTLGLAIWKWRPKILVLRSNMTSMSYIDLSGFLDCWVRKLDTKIHLRMETNWPQLCWWLDTTKSIVSAPAPPCRKMYAATTPQARTLQKAKFPQRREMWWSYSTKSITIIIDHVSWCDKN